MTKKLARVVSIPLTLHRSLAPELTRKKKRDPTYHKHDNAIPEVALIAAVIVVLKMVYGLDGRPRYADGYASVHAAASSETDRRIADGHRTKPTPPAPSPRCRNSSEPSRPPRQQT